MSRTARARVAGLLGATFALTSLLAFPSLLEWVTRAEISMQANANDVVPGPTVVVVGGSPDSMRVDGEPASADAEVAPGLHLLEWRQDYRGGHTRSVGHAQLVGPFQDPLAPSCGVSLLIAPIFLDQLAPVLQSLVQKQLRGMSQWPLGDFKVAGGVNLRWVPWSETSPYERLRTQLEKDLPGDRLGGHLRVAMDIEFENAMVPLSLTVVPIIVDQALTFRIFVNATLDLDNRFFQWVADFFDGNDRVSRLIETEIRREMRNVLDKPPDIPLDGGSTLKISFCQGEQLRFHPAGHVSMPLAIAIDERTPAPPRFASVPAPSSSPMTTPLAVELDRNALGGILHALWASGLLERALVHSTVKAFNEHPTVRDFLSLSIEQAGVHLPPTIDVIPGKQAGLRIRTAARLDLRDGSTRSRANLFAEFRVSAEFLKNPTLGPALGSDALVLSTLQLTCVDDAGRLHPCYSQIIAQLRANQEPLQAQLASLLSDLLLELFTHRTIGAADAPATYTLESTEFHLDANRLRANLSGAIQ